MKIYRQFFWRRNEFQQLLPTEISEYQVFQKAYSYSYVELQIAGEKYLIQPIDFVEEKSPGGGKYTYQVDANDSTDPYGKLDLLFIEDSQSLLGSYAP